MVIPCGSLVSGGLAVNLAVSGGTLNRQRGRGLVSSHADAGGGNWVADSGRHRTQVRRHENTQVTRSLLIGKRRHPVLVTAHVMGAVVPPGRVRRARHLGRWPEHRLRSRCAETTQSDYGGQLGPVCMIVLLVLHAAG
jgi:hypothetical protein